MINGRKLNLLLIYNLCLLPADKELIKISVTFGIFLTERPPGEDNLLQLLYDLDNLVRIVYMSLMCYKFL